MKIFLSYRRTDTQDFTGRLADRLRAEPGIEQVFLDVDGIAPGERFPEKLEQALKATDATLIVIGREWRGPRLFEASDVVRAEARAALVKGKGRVIPVLANDAAMPAAADLPDDLAELPTLNAVSVRHDAFERDVEHLIDRLFGRKKPKGLAAYLQRHPGQALLFRTTAGLALGAALVLGAAVVHHSVFRYGLEVTLGGRGPLLAAIAAVLGLSVAWRLRAGAKRA